MRFSLKDLMAVVAFCAGVAWCASRVGFDDGFFWFAVGVGTITSALFVWLSRNQRRRRLALWVTIPVLLFSFSLMSLALFADAAFLSVVTIFLGRRPPPDARTLSFSAMICGAVALLIGMAPGAGEVRRLMDLRREFPIVSLEGRLKHERLKAARVTPISASVSSGLDEFEQQFALGNYRQFQLRRIHSYEHEAFIRSFGFGVGRMTPLRAESVRQPPLRDIPFAEESHERTDDPYRGWRAFWTAGKSNAAKSLHIASRNDFLDPDSLGAIIEPPLKVVGFIAHALHYPPTASLEDHKAWILDRLELVSLLKFDEPRVYVLDHLPRMDQLSVDNVPTRPLDAFESLALEKLWTAEDVVIDHDGNDYRMLGSLRAASQCLDCHATKRGDLLGAFTYFLRRAAKDEATSIR
jgi:hypothetical protein